ncbi:hypothetical protein [Cryobacterium sp. Y29]|uniref:hypothetical protein n=1 Tax=Cryobacterium sp. Y29 TaxID=2048285 RepID=UPI001E4E0465|nr:hypothetical protein [Cryobacterium sp. Y29]
MSKTWFITGASKGFGREWTEAALERGDSVAGTARKLETLDALVEKYPDTFFADPARRHGPGCGFRSRAKGSRALRPARYRHQ